MDPTVLNIWLGLSLTPASKSLGHLLKRFSNAEEIFHAEDGEIEGALGSHRRDIRRICRRDLDEANRVAAYCSSHGISIITWFDPAYPAVLRDLSDPPAILFCMGDVTLLSSTKTVGIVGTRMPSEYAQKMTFEIARDLARAGAIIVSGMAFGIDGVAAAGSLSVGGKTIAVLGCGLDMTYPAKHAKLRASILQNGLLISEYPPGSPPERFHFPERNRIISGLSRGVFVAEGTLQSGALITANYAAKQGKRLFTLPGRLDSPLAEGPMKLLRDGAHPVSCADDILSKIEKDQPGTFDLSLLLRDDDGPDFYDAIRRYGVSFSLARGKGRSVRCSDPEPEPTPEPTFAPDLSGLSESERALFLRIPEEGSCLSDDLIASGLSAGEIGGMLTMLEIKGLIRMLPGGRVSRAN